MKPFNRKSLRFPLSLLIVCLIAYLPVCSFRFAVKNDAFIFNFPNKFFFSEALRAGNIPLWNPYLNYGFPLYADPGFAWWQPITWIFGLIGYTPYTFTIEVLLYIYLAGLGMYLLARCLKLERITAFVLGCLFMCSGFFIGNLQHINFLTCAAFLPWLTGAWLLYQQKPTIRNGLICSVACYLLCTGGHPAIPIGTIYFFLVLTILYYFFFCRKTLLKSYAIRQLKLLGFCIGLLLPLLLSYIQLLPYYSRSQAVLQSNSLNVGFTLPSYLSFIFPFSTTKNHEWFGTDVSMRNAYFSIGGFLLFLQAVVKRKKPALQSIFLVLGVCMLLLAAGGWLKNSLYGKLPALKFIRTNGEFRVFTIFSFLICLSFDLNAVLLNTEAAVLKLRNWFRKLAGVLALSSLALAFFIRWYIPLGNPYVTFPARVKYFLDHLSFEQSLFISALLAFLLSLVYLYSLYKQRRYFLHVLIADIIINSWLLLPITGVSQHSIAELQSIIDKAPNGFPIPSQQTASPDKPVTPEEDALIGNWNWYSKQIIYTPPITYPSMLKSTEAYLESGDTNRFKNKPFVYLKSGNGTLNVVKFSPGFVKLKTSLKGDDTLVLLQNWFPGWKAFIDNKKSHIQPYQNTFIQLPITRSVKEVSFRFSWL